MQFLHLAIAALLIVGFGWASTIWSQMRVTWRGTSVLAPYAELAISFPYFLILMGCWIIHYDAERILNSRDRPYWSRIGYFINNLRQLILIVGLPVLLFTTQQNIIRFLPEVASSDWFRITSFAILPIIVLVMPRFVKPLLGLQTLPDGPLRQRLEKLAKRLDFHFADILIWPTNGLVVNAMLVGLTARFRYVIFTDRILDEFQPEELDAVFGHEVGHSRHRHPLYYFLFLISSITALTALAIFLDSHFEQYLPLDEEMGDWFDLGFFTLIGAYFFLVFGWLSRRCEREADIYGCRAGSCSNPRCTGHDESTFFHDGDNGLCPTGIRSCVYALEHVGLLVGQERSLSRSLGNIILNLLAWIRAWQHGTLPTRIDYLLSLIENPKKARRYEIRLFILRCCLILGLASVLLALVWEIGWQELLKAL